MRRNQVLCEHSSNTRKYNFRQLAVIGPKPELVKDYRPGPFPQQVATADVIQSVVDLSSRPVSTSLEFKNCHNMILTCFVAIASLLHTSPVATSLSIRPPNTLARRVVNRERNSFLSSQGDGSLADSVDDARAEVKTSSVKEIDSTAEDDSNRSTVLVSLTV